MKFLRLFCALLVVAFIPGTNLAQTVEETPDIILAPNFCSLYPLIISNAVIGQSQPGAHFDNVALGTGPGNYNWLSWAGNTDANTLATSLIAPGDSDSYRNPNGTGDNRLDIGDWVEGAPGVKNGSAVRAGMDSLLGKNIIVPVWSDIDARGANLTYQVVRFAVVELTDYQLNGKGYISFTFKRFTQCYNSRPVAFDVDVEVEAGEPIAITLRGEDADGSELVYQLDSEPLHGEFTGTPPNLTYVSDHSFEGQEHISYRVFDGELLSEPAVIEITVLRRNEPPVITSPPKETTPEQDSYRYQVAVEDPDLDPIHYQLDRAPDGMTVDQNSGLITWLPDSRFVQTVPTFNEQCYVVPTGAVKEYEEGDETGGQSYIAPLFNRVRDAIKNASGYVAPEAIDWHQRNRCLGCHIQTQSVLGLQASLDKAEVDEDAAAYLLGEIVNSQLSDGSIRRSHPEFAKNQTAFALWALSFVPDREATFDIRAKGLDFFWHRRQTADNRTYWTNDHDSGWLKDIASINALVTLSAVRYIIDSVEQPNPTAQQQAVVDNYTALLPSIAEDTLYRYTTADSANNLHLAFHMITLGELRRVASDPVMLERINDALMQIDGILRSRQLNSGGWHRSVSGTEADPLSAAWVGLALDYLDPAITDPAVNANIEFLLNTQQPNGTWLTNSNLFTTRLATTSLVMAYLPVALEHLGNPDVRPGHITLTEGSEGLHQLSVRVANRGLAEIAVPVDVNFYNGTPEAGTLLGSVRLERINSGQALSPSIAVPDGSLTDDIHITLTVDPAAEECEINNNQTQAALVRVRATDPGDLFDTQIFTVNVDDVNESPEITSEAPAEFQAGQAFSYRVTTEDGDAADAHIFRIVDGPEGLFIDPRTGTISAAAGVLPPGTHTVVVEVEDLRGATTRQTFTLTVHANLPPEIVSAPVVRGDEHSGYRYDVDAVDPNPGDELRYSFETSPVGLGIDSSDGLTNWLPNADFVEGHTNANTYCVAEPSAEIGQFEPVVKWHWSGSDYRSSYRQVMSIPVVAQLNDDNADGEVTSDDIPDVIFTAFSGGAYGNPSILRALSGADGSEIWPQADRWGNSLHGPAVADIDGDGLVEIVVGSGYHGGNKSLIAYENDGTLKWKIPVTQYGEPSIADLNNDGVVEIVVANAVYDPNGQRLWTNGSSFDRWSIAVDLDLDGDQEVFINGAAYDENGTLLWESIPGSRAAVGNFDGDDYPEIVVHAGSGSVALLEHDGQTKWGPVSIPGGGGGPFTVADMDGDGEAEIGVAGARYYVVFEGDGTVKWASPTKDVSSAATGSSVFDFEGDGRAEILYADEHFFRIYDGATGDVLYELPNPSGTLYEYPLVVDVDNDNHAEIVLIANNYAFSGPTGVRVLEDANDSWAPTRSIWNQHSYHITNINDDGTVPRFEQPSWLSHNTYRLNTFLDRPALGLPDLTAHGITYDENADTVFVKVKNRGLAPVNSPITVSLVHEHFWLGDQALGGQTFNTLAVGEELEIAFPLSGQTIEHSLRVDVSVADTVQECATDNNSTRAALVEVRAYDPASLFDAQKFAVSIANVNDAPEIISAASSQTFAGQVYSFPVEVSDPDKGETFEYSLVNAPDGLAVGPYSGIVSSDGLPEGVYQFVIRVRDVAGEIAEQPHVLTISPPDNLPPEITSEGPGQANVGEEYRYDVAASDPDGDDILYALSRTQPGMTIDQSTGQIRWTPQASDAGIKTAEVTVVDQHGAAAKQYFLIEVIDPAVDNQTPVITSVPSGVVYAGKTFEYQVDASDPDGDRLSYDLETVVSGMSISEFGLFSWLPDPSLVGQQVVVEIRVSDGRGGLATQKLTLPVNESANHPPIITSVPALQVAADDPYHYTVEATDQDGDAFSIALLEAPNGMTLSGNQIAWTPASVQAGQVHSVAIMVKDARGAASTQTFGIAVNDPLPPNAAPVIDSVPGSLALIGQEYTYDVIARDVDGDSLTYSVSGAPTGMTLNQSGNLRWTPDATQSGLHDITVEVSDGRAWARQRYTLQAAVADDNNYPEITSWPRTLTAADLLYTYQMQAADADGDPLSFGALDLPEGMTITSEGLLQWTPTASQEGMHDVVLFVDDGKGRTLQSFTIRVTSDPLPLNTSIVVTPDIVDAGETVTINIFNEGGQGTIEAELRIDGEVVPLNPFGQTQIVAASTGVHTIDVVVTDGIDTLQKTATYSVRDPGDTAAPIVSLNTPADDAVVTSPADIIGTVQDANLAHYRVLVALKGQQDYTEIASGNSNVSDGTLGLLDPTLLHNGIYQIVLEATDVNGQLAMDSTTVLVDGDMKVGHFALTFEDLSIDLAGIPIRVTRTYDTRQRAENLDFGHGWSVDYQNVRVQESRTLGFSWSLNYYRSGFFGKYCVEPNGEPIVTVRLSNGDLEKFRARAEPECTSLVPTIDVRIAFEPLTGTRSTLEQTRYGLLRLANGHIVDLTEPEDPVDPDAYRLTTADGMVYSLDQDFGVRRIDEPGGEYVTYSDDGVHHSQGYAIQFERDAANRITALVTPDGRRVEYTYTAASDLNTVTDMGGDVTRHAYLFRLPHYLEEIVDPRGVRATRMEYDDSGRLLAVTDADGNRVEYTHDIAGNTELIRDRNGNQTVYVYDDNGRVTAETNALGDTIIRTYNAVGDVLSETNALGETTSWTYDSRGNRLTETNPLGHTTEFSYTQTGEVLTEVDPLGNLAISNTYDSRSLKLTSTTDALGNITSLHWDVGTGGSSCSTGASRGYTDAEGNTHQVQPICAGALAHLPRYELDANGTRTDFDYDSSGRKTAETTTRTDADGNTVTLRTEYQYDAEGRVIATTHPDGSTTRTEYNSIDKVAVEIDALGRRTEFEYDDRGNQVLVRYPDGSTTTKAYDPEGNLIAETDWGGRTTRHSYDAANRRVETILPDETPFDDSDNPRTRTEYDAAGRVTADVDPKGNRIEYVYDAAGQRTLVRDALGNETHYEYDAAGRRTAIIDARGNRTDFIHDAAGRLIETVFPDGTRRTTGYDALGRKISETDELGRTTQYGYDPLGRLIQVTDPAGNITRFGYDEQGNKIRQTDAEGRTTRWAYDDMGRTTSRTLPLGQVEYFTYNEAGNRISHTNFNGATTTYSYDELNREVLRDYPADADVITTYTASGRVDTIEDGNGLTDYHYDAQDRLTRIDYPSGSWLAYAYDAAGNRILLSSQHSDTHYSFDALNRLTSITDPNGTTTFSFDPVGNRAGVTFANGVQTTYSYDSRNRLTRIDTENDTGSTLLGMTYVLNANGTRAEIREDSGRTVRYTYDILDRLAEEATTDASIGNRTTAWTYDTVGNRLSETKVTASGTAITTYVYDDNDRLLSETDSTGTTLYIYDANGNLLEKAGPDSTATYAWNDDNRLTQYSSSTDTVTFTYDSLGIRQSAVRNGVTTHYLVDSNRDYAEVIAEENASGIAQVLYTHADELVSQQQQGVFSYYHADGLGSTRLLTDTTGLQTDSYIYEAYGEIEARIGSTQNDYLFTGEQLDVGLNQYYLRARYYDQGIGRFTRMDEWMGNRRNPVTLHKYLYANVNPANMVDPSGNFSLGQVSAASSITAVLMNSAITGYSLARIGGAGTSAGSAVPDGVLISFRGASFGVNARALGLGASLGFDAVYSRKTNRIAVFASYDASISPLATFKKGRAFSLKGSWSIGPVWGITNPSTFRGYGASANWPARTFHLLCRVGAMRQGPLWGYACQSQKLALGGRGLTVGFGFAGFSNSSTGFLKVSRGTNIASDFLGWATEINTGPLVDTIKPIAHDLSSISNIDSLIDKLDGL